MIRPTGKPVLPIILGDGLLFFDQIGQEQALHLKDVKAYKSGMVELWYEIRNKQETVITLYDKEQ